MYKVHLTKSFKKDAKALSQADRILSMQIIDTLAKGEKLILKTAFLKNELIFLMQSFVMMSILTIPIFVILLIFTSVNLKKPLVFMGQLFTIKQFLIFHKLFSKGI